ncbi:MAG: EVE domain-containing protein [Candidatus Bathyarchaeia archaeon]
MNVWLCPVKPRNWRIIKNVKLFGAPKHAAKIMNQLQPGDLLLFHVLKPINGIVAVCKIESQVFEDYTDIWGKDRYPLRVKIKFIQDLTADGKKPVPLSLLFREMKTPGEMVIEPYLKNVWITKISKRQFYKVINFSQKQSFNKNLK